MILGIDVNDDARNSPFARMLHRMGLNEAILGLHQNADPPETCNKNHNRKPIDGIYVTPGISPTAAGYTNYGTVVDSATILGWACRVAID